jgi:hypothetical protein
MAMKTPKAFNSKARGRRASGAPWVHVNSKKVTPKALHNASFV